MTEIEQKIAAEGLRIIIHKIETEELTEVDKVREELTNVHSYMVQTMKD